MFDISTCIYLFIFWLAAKLKHSKTMERRQSLWGHEAVRQGGEEAWLYGLWPSQQGNGRAEARGGLGGGQNHFITPLECKEWEPLLYSPTIPKSLEQLSGNTVASQKMFVECIRNHLAFSLCVHTLPGNLHKSMKRIRVRDAVSLNT